MRPHPPDAWLRETLRVPKKGSDRILEHVEGCGRCKGRLTIFTSAGRFGRSAERVDYGPAIERSYQILEQRQTALARERGDAPRLLARLLGLNPAQQQLLLRNSRRFQKWGLLELLLQYGEKETFIDPAHAEEIFRLALEVSTHLDSYFYGKQRIEDMRARAWGYIGNIHRIQMDLSTSEEMFKEAFLRLRKGTGDSMERALLFEKEVSLRRRQRRLDDAVRLSQQAITIFGRNGENQLGARALIGLSINYRVMGSIKEALSALYRSLDLLDPVCNPRLALGALHNLTTFLAVAGRFTRARRILAQTQPLYTRFQEPRWQSRRKWVEARIAVGLGRYSEAEVLMRDVRDGFLSVSAPMEIEVASRELASIRARLGAAS